MAESKGPGDFQFKKMTLSNYSGSKSIDLSDLLYEISIEEKIDNVTIKGQISIIDSQNLLDNFPIIGEETLYMSIEDFYGHIQELNWHVTGISPIKILSKSSQQEYTLFFRSKDFVATEKTEIRRSFRTSLSETAQTVFNEYFETDKELDIEETSGEQTIIIPAKTPYETMMFLARKSFSVDNASSTYKFFESRDRFHYTTMERLIDKASNEKIEERQVFTFIDPKLVESKPEKSMRNFISYTPISRMNLINEMRSGAMVSKITLLDLAEKTVEETVYKHYENVENYAATDKTARKYHTDKFANDYFGEDNILQSYLVFNDTAKPSQFYEDIIPKRASNAFYMNNIVVQAESYGSWDIKLGDMINFLAPRVEVDDKQTDHTTTSGWYLVTHITNRILGDEWKTTYVLVKTALKGTLDE